MNKRDALRLQPGQFVSWGDSMWTEKMKRQHEGVVMQVTPGGGVRVRVEGGASQWVPYHHIYAVGRHWAKSKTVSAHDMDDF